MHRLFSNVYILADLIVSLRYWTYFGMCLLLFGSAFGVSDYDYNASSSAQSNEAAQYSSYESAEVEASSVRDQQYNEFTLLPDDTEIGTTNATYGPFFDENT